MVAGYQFCDTIPRMTKQYRLFNNCQICGEIIYYSMIGWQKASGRNLCTIYCGDCRFFIILPVNNHLSRARLVRQPATLTFQEYADALVYFKFRCAYCGAKPTYHSLVLEHFISIDLCWGTTADNCIPACQSCNVSKRGKYPLDETTEFWKRNKLGILEVKEYLDTKKNV